MTPDVASQVEVATALGGITWSQARRVVESCGLRVWTLGKRRWQVERGAFERLLQAIHECQPAKAVAS